MPAGYSGTPLLRKLGIKEGFRISVLDEPDDYWTLLGPLPSAVHAAGPAARRVDLIHAFVRRRTVLARRLPACRVRIVPNGMIWISWPKKASGVDTDVTEDVVREIAFANTLVDVKVCAVDEVWSGLKLVIPVKDRKR